MRTLLPSVSLIALTVSVLLCLSACPLRAAPLPVRPTTGIGHIALVLDGKPCGIVKSMTGGSVRALLNAPIGVGADGQSKPKHLAGMMNDEPITLTVGMNASPGMTALYQWILYFIGTGSSSKNGGLIFYDAQMKPLDELQFTRAFISGVTFPACDAASKEQSYLTVTLEATKIQEGPAGTFAASFKPTDFTAQDTPMLGNGFQLQIPGLACDKISTVDAITLQRDVTDFIAGVGGNGSEISPVMVVPNLSLTLPDSDASTWWNWMNGFIVKGQDGPTQEKSGYLSYKGTDGTELARLTFTGLGICQMGFVPESSPTDNIPHDAVGLYCDNIVFSQTKPAAL